MSDVELKELVASLTRTQQETARALAETDRKLAEIFERGDKRAAEMDRHLAHLESVHGIQYGRLLEAVVEPSCLALFQERRIKVAHSMRRVTARLGGEEMEIDILLVNQSELVVVEVKSAFRVEDVNDLLDDLQRFREFFPSYAKHTLYGAVAAPEYLEESSRYAARKGLFVLKFTGGLMAIANPLNFRAKKF